MGGEATMPGGMGGMMARMMGFLGDTILVNDRPDASIEVATHPYRLRILNGSNSRIYKLAWHDGRIAHRDRHRWRGCWSGRCTRTT